MPKFIPFADMIYSGTDSLHHNSHVHRPQQQPPAAAADDDDIMPAAFVMHHKNFMQITDCARAKAEHVCLWLWMTHIAAYIICNWRISQKSVLFPATTATQQQWQPHTHSAEWRSKIIKSEKVLSIFPLFGCPSFACYFLQDSRVGTSESRRQTTNKCHRWHVPILNLRRKRSPHPRMYEKGKNECKQGKKTISNDEEETKTATSLKLHSLPIQSLANP